MIEGQFLDEYDPTIEDSYRKQCHIDDGPETKAIPVIVEILDTAGQEEYSALREQYIKTGEGFLLVYDVTSRISFEEVKKLHEQICQVKDRENTPIVVLGNKTDIAEAEPEKRQVSRAEGLIMAKNFGKSVVFWETSARMRQHVQDAFFDLVRLIRRDNKEPPIPLHRDSSNSNIQCTSSSDVQTDSSGGLLPPIPALRKAASKASLRSTNTVLSTARKLSNSSSSNNLHFGSNNNSNINLANCSGSINSTNSNASNTNSANSNTLSAAFGGATKYFSLKFGKSSGNRATVGGQRAASIDYSSPSVHQRERYYSQGYVPKQLLPHQKSLQQMQHQRGQSEHVAGADTGMSFDRRQKSVSSLKQQVSLQELRQHHYRHIQQKQQNLQKPQSHPQLSKQQELPRNKVMDANQNAPILQKKRFVEPPLPPLPTPKKPAHSNANSIRPQPSRRSVNSTPTIPESPDALPVPPTNESFSLPSTVSPTSSNGLATSLRKTISKMKVKIMKPKSGSSREAREAVAPTPIVEETATSCSQAHTNVADISSKNHSSSRLLLSTQDASPSTSSAVPSAETVNSPSSSKPPHLYQTRSHRHTNSQSLKIETQYHSQIFQHPKLHQNPHQCYQIHYDKFQQKLSDQYQEHNFHKQQLQQQRLQVQYH